jgi:hypothetical protein
MKISRGADQSTSALLSHMEKHHKKVYGLLKDARSQKREKTKPAALKPVNLRKDTTPTQLTLLNYEVFEFKFLSQDGLLAH